MIVIGPVTYQAEHPWHWLTYGQNSSAVGLLISAVVNLLTVTVLLRTLRAVNRQALAADRQAGAAEEQVKAAISAAAVSDAQRIATEESAKAEHLHSELIQQEMLAHLRPILVLGKRDDLLLGVQWYVENHGEGAAFGIEGRYNKTHQEVLIAQNIIGPGREAAINIDWSLMSDKGLRLSYTSQDNRTFVTVFEGMGSNFHQLRQTALEVEVKYGD